MRGDKAEREALAFLTALTPDLVVPCPQRILGLGRHLDTGDLDVYPDVAVQVKAFSNVVAGARLAAVGAAAQAVNRGVPLSVGVVLRPRVARSRTDRWIIATTTWPTLLDPGVAVTGNGGLAVAWVTDQAGRPSAERIVVNRRSGTVDVVYAHPDAWG